MPDSFRFDRLFIGGEWVEPLDGGVRPSIDPATGAPWGDVAWGGERDVDRAVAAAKQAFEGPWRKIPPWERAALLRKFADLYATRVDRSEEHTSELQSLMRTSYAVFCLKTKTTQPLLH